MFYNSMPAKSKSAMLEGSKSYSKDIMIKYDLLTSSYRTFEDFEAIVGFKYLKGIHLNDSKKELASRVDRHHNIGKGLLGLDVFRRMMNDPRFDDMPIILETPDSDLWEEEIELLYSLKE